VKFRDTLSQTRELLSSGMHKPCLPLFVFVFAADK
jgi:hypothetical protein